jgi:uncharacterized protein
MAKQGNEHAAPNFSIKIDGKESVKGDQGELSLKNGDNILGVRIEKQLFMPSYFSVRLNLFGQSGEAQKAILLDQMLEGKPLEILSGYEDGESSETLMKGEILYMEPHFDREGTSYIELAGFDHVHRTVRGTHRKTWGDGVESQEAHDGVVKELIGDAGDPDSPGSDSLSAGGKPEGQVKVPYIAMYNTNLFEFARSMGFDLRSDNRQDDKTVKFVNVSEQAKNSPALTVCYDKEEGNNPVLGVRANFRMAAVYPVREVEVRGWDPAEKKAIVGIAKECDYDFGGTQAHQVVGKALYGSGSSGKRVIVVDHPVASQEEAEGIAKGIFHRLAMSFVTGEVEIVGNVKVEPGEVVECKGYGARFDGKYLISACTHSYFPDGGAYRTVINVSRNSHNDA